jgi:predicted metal-dependent HD superfamily phosphohydrolase
MNFYTNFFDLWKYPPPAWTGALHIDFMTWQDVRNIFSARMLKFLSREYKIHSYTAQAIAHAVFDRMSDYRLHYHTPVHVLAIFDFAKMHDINLLPWEELAIWFHDSVYDVNNVFGDNERLSADFMYAMMRPYVKDAYDANAAIVQTSCHMEPTCPERYAKVLDLDMCGFAAPRDVQKVITECIRKEYDTDLTTFNQGRKKFLEKLISKGPIYRTAEFAKFEPLAQENIRLDLEELNASAV